MDMTTQFSLTMRERILSEENGTLQQPSKSTLDQEWSQRQAQQSSQYPKRTNQKQNTFNIFLLINFIKFNKNK